MNEDEAWRLGRARWCVADSNKVGVGGGKVVSVLASGSLRAEVFSV